MTMTSRPAIAMPQPEPENCWRPDARPLTEMKILIVDDDPANVELLQAILADAGFRCTKSVTDSRCTMDVTKDLQPDLVLLDLTMPHVDGFTVIDSLRGADGDLVLPIIVLTGDCDPKTKLRVLQAGVTDFLTKPFDLAEVLARVTNSLKSRRRYQLVEDHRAALESARANALKLRGELWELQSTRTSQVVM
jgi:DNA-binding response OmpR family regulator